MKDEDEMPVWDREIDSSKGRYDLVRELFWQMEAYFENMNELHCATAVLLSSLGKAHIDIAGYRVCIISKQEPSQAALARALNQQPHLRTVYSVMVARKEAGTYGEPQQRFPDHTKINSLVDALLAWHIPVTGWQPDEEEE